MYIRDQRAVFIAGVHGVGKSSLGKSLAERLDVEHVSASSLIKMRKELATSKAIQNISSNQDILVNEFRKIKTDKQFVLLDGHFCLLNSNKEIQRLPVSVFRKLNITKVLLLTCAPKTLMARIFTRDGERNEFSVNTLNALQDAEVRHAKYVCEELNISIFQIDTTDNLSKAKLSLIIGELQGGKKE